MARADMFLKMTGTRSGEIVGESSDKAFSKQVEVTAWSWGMTAPSGNMNQPTGRRQLGDLHIVKKVDKASTALMSVLATNELMKTVVLTVRKAGGTAPVPYLVVTLGKARVVSYSVQSELSDDGAPTLTEHIAFGFTDVNIDYTMQSSTGASLGATSFSDSVGNNA